jgi:hypothetical protein
MTGRPSKNLSLQKDTERRHIELFIELAGLRAGLEFGDRPDCVLLLAGRRIGLEHRELCDQDLLWTQPHLKRLSGILKAELEARELALHVRVHLPPRSTWLAAHPSRFVPLARRIAGLAGQSGAERMIFGEDQLAMEGVGLVAVQRLEKGSCATAQIEGGPVEDELAHRVLEAIRAKEVKLSAYDANLSRCWLLLVTGDTLTQPMDAMRIEGLDVRSRFDRVYLLDAGEPRLLCLQTAAAAG